MAEPTSLFLTLSGSSDQVQSVLHAPTRIEDVIRELSLAPDSSESESESDADNQEDDNANTVTGSIRGGTAEPDGDMGQHSTSDEEDQLFSGDDEPQADSDGEETTSRLENQSEFMEMEVIDVFQARSGEPIRAGEIISMDNVEDDGEWFGRVVDIRQSAGATPKIWFKCHWFYNIYHIQNEVKTRRSLKKRLTFDMAAIGPNELIETPDHIDIFVSTVCKGTRGIFCSLEEHSLTFDGKLAAIAPVVVIRDEEERSVTQTPVPEGSLYTRIVFNFKQYKGSKKNYIPYSFKSCVCERSPSKKRAKRRDNAAMYFCPNVACRRWLHQDCLQAKPYILRRPTNTSLESRLAENVPDWDADELIQYQYGYTSSSTPPNQLRQILQKVAGRQIVREKGQPLANMFPICFARALLKMEKERDPVQEIDWYAIEHVGFVKAELKKPIRIKDPLPMQHQQHEPFRMASEFWAQAISQNDWNGE
ncbi:hypothetical protein FRC04_001979 [Tulasnella sp. 424]|nr:hypothetical protein FRC04_001979 [Tulasnella sp. 424]